MIGGTKVNWANFLQDEMLFFFNYAWKTIYYEPYITRPLIAEEVPLILENVKFVSNAGKKLFYLMRLPLRIP